jgi:hypothetical protein
VRIIDVDYFARFQPAVCANFILAQFQIEVAEKSCLDWQENVEFGVKKRRKISN